MCDDNAFGRTCQRRDVGQRAGRNHESAAVHAQMPRQSAETAGDTQELRLFLDSSVFIQNAADLRGREAQDAGRVAYSTASAVRENSCDHRDVLFTPAAIAVVDHFVTPIIGNVNIDVRTVSAPRIHEAFEVKIVLERAAMSEAEQIRHNAGRGRAADLDRDVPGLCEPDDFMHVEEIVSEPVTCDDRKLGSESGFCRLDCLAGVLSRQCVFAQIRKVRDRCLAGGHRQGRQQRRIELECEPATCADGFCSSAVRVAFAPFGGLRQKHARRRFRAEGLRV